MKTNVRQKPALWRILVVGLLAVAATGVVVANSASWIGSTVPGFFVMPNRVVSSLSPGGPNAAILFQRQVLAVDGIPVTASDSVYDYARRHPPLTAIRYTLRGEDRIVEDVTWRTQTFTLANYLSLFGVNLLNGAVFLIVALAIWWFHRPNQATLALTGASSIAGIFFISTFGLHGPSWLFSLHLFAEALAVATLLHLALAFPTNRIANRSKWVLPVLYLPSLVFAIAYAAGSSDPTLYGELHSAAAFALVAGAAAVVGSILHGLWHPQSILAHRQSALAGIGILAAMVVAAVLSTLTRSPDGRIAWNTVASASFVLPLCIAYAAAKQDSFAIDSILRRSMAHTFVIVALASIYAIAMSLDWSGAEIFPESPFALTVLAFGVLLFGGEIRDRSQVFFDRIFFGKNYHVEQALAALSRVLASAHTLDAVDKQIRDVLAQTLGPKHAKLFLRCEDHEFRSPGRPNDQRLLRLPSWRMARLERGDLQLRREEGGETSSSAEQSSWSELDAEILVPIKAGGSLQAVLALGAKRSSRSYSADDVAFLRTAANQIALAVSNASAFQKLEQLNQNLEQLNESLERQVDERTAALHASSEEVNRSLEKLQSAYVKLEQSQSNLLRSDRLATLGRLTAGLAHEMNTPLSAVLNSLKLIRDLGHEYKNSIDDSNVLPEDHREMADELICHAESATEWAGKAAAFIRSVKSHGREAGSGIAQRFAVRDVVADARGLVAHRLRAASCQIDLVEEPLGITLNGDPSRFNQVLVNLLTNAIDAYEDRGMSSVRIEIKAWHQNGSVCVQVRDWAGGIPASTLPHIFDELYTTKGPGRGTGLGLWISRNIVEETLGGTLDVITNSEGSCFIAEFPLPDSNPTIAASGEQTEAARTTRRPAPTPAGDHASSLSLPAAEAVAQDEANRSAPLL